MRGESTPIDPTPSQGAGLPAPMPDPAAFDPAAIERPESSLLTYYAIISAFTVVGFPIVFLVSYCKYATLKYKFDDKGVSMSYGVLFRKEVYLTYRRIQDIHVTRNFIHRWLGLAEVAVQTASGNAGAELTIEGIRNPELIRDYLYSRMRGVEPSLTSHASAARQSPDAAVPADTVQADDEALSLLREIRDDLRALRAARGDGREERA